MKKRFLNLLVLGTAMLLAGCGDNASSSASESSSSEISSVASSASTSSASSAEEVDTIVSIASIRDAATGEIFTIKGIVVKHVYTGQGTPYITGMMVADETGCIYVYGETSAKSCTVGNEIVVKGTKAYYIPKTDTGAAASTNYKGQQQLTYPEIVSNDNGTHEIPSGIIRSIDSLEEVMDTPLTNDITGNLYRVKGRIHSVTSTGPDVYTNYYLYGLNRIDSIAFYTQSNGKDYTWLDEYKDKAVDITFAVLNAKPGTGLWRGLPIAVNGETEVTAREEADFAAERALSKISDEYTASMNNTLPTTDDKLEGVTVSYTSSDSEVIAFTENNEITVTVPSEKKEVQVTASATYQGETGTKTKTVSVYEKIADYELTTIAEAKEAPTDTELYLEGVVARRTYKSGATSPLGCFLVDTTGSIVVYQSASTLDNISEIEEGNKIVVKGKIGRYIKNGITDYTGDIQIMDVEVLSNDHGNHSIPTESVEEKTISEIVDTPSTTNITGNIYKVTAKIVKNSQSYRLADPADTEKTLLLYSQKSGSDFAWLDEKGTSDAVTLYVGVQNANLSSGKFLWRGCPIAFVD